MAAYRWVHHWGISQPIRREAYLSLESNLQEIETTSVAKRHKHRYTATPKSNFRIKYWKLLSNCIRKPVAHQETGWSFKIWCNILIKPWKLIIIGSLESPFMCSLKIHFDNYSKLLQGQLGQRGELWWGVGICKSLILFIVIAAVTFSTKQPFNKNHSGQWIVSWH